jgi:hypothetical protein
MSRSRLISICSEAGQQNDGGWMFDWLSWSPAQTSAWRGAVTIRAPMWLRPHGRL